MIDFYPDLKSLTEQNGEAKRYYSSLPYNIKQSVQINARKIHSFDSLRGSVQDALNQSGR